MRGGIGCEECSAGGPTQTNRPELHQRELATLYVGLKANTTALSTAIGYVHPLLSYWIRAYRGVFMWIGIAIWVNCESNVKLILNFANEK